MPWPAAVLISVKANGLFTRYFSVLTLTAQLAVAPKFRVAENPDTRRLITDLWTLAR